MNQSHKTAVTLMNMADSFALKYAEHMISGLGQETRMKQGSDTATPHNKSQHLRLHVTHHNKCELQCDAKYALHSSVTTRKLHISKILAFPAMAIEESPVLCMAIVGRERRQPLESLSNRNLCASWRSPPEPLISDKISRPRRWVAIFSQLSKGKTLKIDLQKAWFRHVLAR